MGILNPHQKITWVLPGKPFGNGKDGDATISADPNLRASLTTISAGNTDLLIGDEILQNGDLFKVIQERGLNAGQWEWGLVVSGGGTQNIVTKKPLQYSYDTSGDNVAQVVRVPMYRIVTLSSFTVTAWNGSIGGRGSIVARKSIGGSGTLSFNGSNGTAASTGDNQTIAGATGGGFRGGSARNDAQDTKISNAGEGTGGPERAYNSSVNGNGGGGGGNGSDESEHGGGGGGNGTAGTVGANSGGQAGGTSGSADLTLMTMGGGGGGSWIREANGPGSGGSGGAALDLISPTVDISGMTLVNLNGGNGAFSTGSYSAGAGSGGSLLIICRDAILGSNKATANGGTGRAGGGTGGNGRVAIHHSGDVTGTTSPTFTDVLDPTIREAGGFGLLLTRLKRAR